jgi:putative acetyltransferase
MFYVHPAVARQGVGTMLYEAIEKLAAARGAKKLTVDASDTARAFFEMKGFEPRHRQTVAIGDYWLGNTRMERVI